MIHTFHRSRSVSEFGQLVGWHREHEVAWQMSAAREVCSRGARLEELQAPGELEPLTSDLGSWAAWEHRHLMLCLPFLLSSVSEISLFLASVCLLTLPSPPLSLLPTPSLGQDQDITTSSLQHSPSPALSIPHAAPRTWHFLLSLLPTPSWIHLLPQLYCFLSFQVQ